MRSIRKARVAPFYGYLVLVLAFSALSGFSLAATTRGLTYSPGELILEANQFVTVGPITLRMQSNCILTLSNASGQTLWQSGAAEASCAAPEAAFEKDATLVVSSSVNGRRSVLFASHTSGSAKLVLGQAFPYLTIVNSDGSSAWKALGSLTLNSIDPPMMATIGARGDFYSRDI
jgi:hypothetical protein